MVQFIIIYVISCFTYYQSSGLFDQRSIHAVHFVVQAAGIAQVMAGAVAPPQGRRNGTAVHTLAALREHVRVDQLRQIGGGHGAGTCCVVWWWWTHNWLRSERFIILCCEMWRTVRAANTNKKG